MSRFEGKLFSILGDSLSAFEGCVTPGYPSFYGWRNQFETNILGARDMWWGEMRTHFGMELLANNSWAGSTVTKMPSHMTESYGCSDLRCASLGEDDVMPDLIFVFIGANDRGYGRPLTDNGSGGTDIGVFPNAYSVMLDKIRHNYPDAELWCITMPCTDVIPDERTAAYNDVIKSVAAAHRCRVIDLFACDLSGEPLHPGYRGMKALADKIIADMEVTDE